MYAEYWFNVKKAQETGFAVKIMLEKEEREAEDVDAMMFS